MARLQVIVDKTAGQAELEAMALLTEYIRRRTSGGAEASEPSAGRTQAAP